MTAEPTAAPILVVEDDVPTQNLLRAVLQRFGYAAEVASNGSEAIAKLEATPYAAVILDIMMPVVGGPAVVDFLSAMTAPVPVIVCSAAGPRALPEFDTNVVKAIVRKPFEIEHLIAVVESVTRR